MDANRTISMLTIENERLRDDLAEAQQDVGEGNLENEARKGLQDKNTQKFIRQQKLHEKHMKGLEKIMFVISHKVRQPVSNIMGITTQLEDSVEHSHSHSLLGYLKQSVFSLDVVTRELTAIIAVLRRKVQKKLNGIIKPKQK